MRLQKIFIWALSWLLLCTLLLSVSSLVHAQTQEPPSAPPTEIIELTEISPDATEEIAFESQVVDTTGSLFIIIIMSVSVVAILIYAAFGTDKKQKSKTKRK